MAKPKPTVMTKGLVLMLLACFAITSLNAQVSRTPWQKHDIGYTATEKATVMNLPGHGDISLYQYAAIPAQNDGAWQLASLNASGNIQFSQSSRLLDGTCYQRVDFTYFQTILTIPADLTVTNCSVGFDAADDGVRVYVFNATHTTPESAFVPGSEIKLGQPPVTTNIASLLVPGENRIVFVQADDCPFDNNMTNGRISINGTTVNTIAATALNFDGADDRVVVNNINLANTSFTVEFMARRNGSGNYDIAIGAGDGTQAANKAMHVGFRDNNNFTFAFYGNDLEAPGLSDNLWHHWACVYKAGVASGNNRFIYRDGVLVASDRSSSSFAGAPTLILGDGPYFGNNFNGDIDEVRVWSRALCQSEIQNNRSCELGGGQTSLLAYYKLNQGLVNADNTAISSVTDASGNGNNGAMVNFAKTGTSSNWVVGTITGSCSAYVPPAVTISAGGPTTFCNGGSVVLTASAGASYLWNTGAITQSINVTQPGSYFVTVTNANGCTGTSAATTVSYTTGTDTDGDGIPDACDADDDNDGIPDAQECNKSNFFWSDVPAVNGTIATGTINGISYTYTSSRAVETSSFVFNHAVFPSSYNVPNITCILNQYTSDNTLTFARPISNPVLVFSSIGAGNIPVPIEFSNPVEILWSTAVVQNTPTRITGNEGYAIVRLNGTFSNISFKYLANEYYVNFLFGADFQTCGDTDGDGVANYLDTDSDNDGCSDALEGSQNPPAGQIVNGRLTGGVDASGIPLVVNGGQGIGTSQTSNVNCNCQVGIDKTAPTIVLKSAGGSLTGLGTVNTYFTSNPALSHAHGIAYDLQNNTVFVTDQDLGNDVVEFRATQPNNSTLSQVSRFHPALTSTIEGIAFDATDNTLWIVDHAGFVGHFTRTGGTLGSYSVAGTIPAGTFSAKGLGIAIENNYLWVDNGVTAYRFNKVSGTYTGFSFSTGQPGITYDPERHVIWSSGWNDNRYRAYNPATGALVFTSAPMGLIQGHDVSIGAGRIWVATENTSPDRIYSIEIIGGAIDQIIECHSTYTDPGYTATDNCGTPAVTTSGSVNPNVPGTYPVTYTATDAAGNISKVTRTVTVLDRTAPVPNVGTLPVVTGECSATVTAPTATDACAGTITATTTDPTSYSSQGTFIVRWTYKDASGNTSTQNQTVIVDDNTPPVIACPFNITVNVAAGQCGSNVTYSKPSATDNCGAGILPTSLEGYTYQGTFGGHTYFLSNTATTPEAAHAAAIALGGHLVTINSLAENTFVSAMNSAFIWIGYTDRDVEGTYRWVTNEPVVYTNWNGGEPNNAGNEDWAVINWGPNGTWNDWGFANTALYAIEFEGGGIPTTLVSGPASGGFFPVGTTSVTYRATDAGGNTVNCTFNVTVVDNINPTITAPANVSVFMNPGSCFATNVNLGTPVFNDNCPGVTVSNNAPSQFGPGLTVVSWTARDAAGNTSTVIQTVTVSDNQNPTVTCPGNITRNTDPNTCGASITLPQPTFGDNCSVVEVTWVMTGATTGSSASSGINFVSPRLYNVGTTTITYTVKDKPGIGNSATCSFSVTVIDNQHPVINGIANRAASSFSNACGATVPVSASASDICGIAAPPIGVRSDGQPLNVLFPVGVTTITWSVSDVNGNTTTATQLVAVLDRTPPVWNCVGPITVNTDPNTCGAKVTFEQLSVTDNCSVTVVQTSGLPNGSIYPVGTTLNTFVATDASGNTATCSFNVTVKDNQPPVLLGVPADMTAECNPPAPANVTAGDNCPGVGTVQYNEVKKPGACPNNYLLIRTWTVTDAHGNTSSASQTIIVQDTQAPVISTSAADLTVECDGNGNSAQLQAWLTSNGGAAATDACGTVKWSNNFTALTDDCGATGSAVVTFTATDDCGNSSTTTATFRIVDKTAPTFTRPADVTIYTTANCSYDASLSKTGDVTDESDNCSTGIEATYTDAIAPGSCAGTYVITRTWSLVDNCGNAAASQVQMITVADNTAPLITCPSDATANCQDNTSPSALGKATATDNCTSAVKITYSDVSTQNANANHKDHYNYTITRTWTATDDCGNASSCTQLITVQDVTAPVALCKPVTVTLVNGSASISTGDINNGSTDNCSPLSFSLSKTSFDCSNIGANVVTLSVTDVSGNTSTCQATVTVIGEIPTCSIASVPTSNVYTGGNPNNLYLGYGAQSTVLQLSVPQSGAPYTFSWSGNGPLSSTSAQSPVFTPTAGGTYVFTVLITNKYGCTTTCKVSICVTDIRVMSGGTWDGKRVYVCHVPPGSGIGNTLEVSVNAVPSHIGPLGHANDRLGRCEVPLCTPSASSGVPTKYTKAADTEVKVGDAFTVKLSPTPTTSYFVLQVMSSDRRTPVTVKMMNALGQVIETRKGSAGDLYKFSKNYVAGTYFFEVKQGEHTKAVKGIKAE
jgi:hypothetical protein